MRIVLLAMLTILPNVGYAETLLDNETETIAASADKIIEATISLDFKTVVDFMPQKLVDAAGGKEKLIEMSAMSFRELKSNGLKISNFTYEMPNDKTVTSLNTIVLIPTQMEIKSDAVTIKSDSYLIGFKPQGGSEWQFVDASGIKNREGIEFLLPEYPKDKLLPQATHQVFEN